MKNNILVVDDENDIRWSIKGLLEDENYVVRVAKNSDEALDAVSKRVPDLVLLDIWLENSKLDGLGLLNEIHSKFINVPCIMISGHGNIDIAVNAIRSGASDFIEKPFESERLLITLERVLELSKLKKEHKDLWQRAGGDIELKNITDNTYTIFVKDTGMGLPGNILEDLTDPYVTTRKNGTGLGLAIVKKIMEDHNGKLILDNLKNNSGVCVSLVFSNKV